MVAPVTNYSVHMNARPALAGGAFTAGFAVCNPNNAGWVVANTTNLAGGAVDIGGIALETAVSGGASVQVLTAGYCPPEVIGTLSGTGGWVTVGSTGALSRSSAVTAATVGKYQSDGGVIVDLALQSGGAVTGNATAIQGVTVSSASATRSHVLRGDGTNLRTVRDGYYHAVDWGVVADGVTDDYAALQSFFGDMTRGHRYMLPDGPMLVNITADRTSLRIGTTGGLLGSGIVVTGPQGSEQCFGGGAILRFAVTDIATEAGTYVSRSTNASFQRHWRLGGFAGQLGAHHKGLWCWVWNCQNVGPWMISGVYDNAGNPLSGGATSGGYQVSLYSTQFSGQPYDDTAFSGSIMARVDVRGVEITDRGSSLENCTLDAYSGRIGALLSMRNPDAGTLCVRQGAQGLSVFSTAGWASRYGMMIGSAFVPSSTSPSYAATAQDGTSTTITRVADTAGEGNGNCSEGRVSRCWLYPSAGYHALIHHGSGSGQSYDWLFEDMYLYPSVTGYLVSGRYGAGAQANWTGTQIAAGDDFVFRVGTIVRPVTYERIYNEGVGAFWTGGPGTGSTASFVNCFVRPSSAVPHASGCIIESNCQGPVSITGGHIGHVTVDVNSCVVRSKGSGVGQASAVSITGALLGGRPTMAPSGVPAYYSGAVCRGLWKLAGTEELDLEDEDGSAVNLFTSYTAGGKVAPSKFYTLNGSGPAWTDDTTDAGNATNADTAMTWATVGGGLYVAYSQRFCALVFDYLNGTAGIAGTGVWEFYNSSGTWTAFGGVTDATSGFTAAAADGLEVRWTMPTMANAANFWASASATTITGGAIVDATARYWVRFRTTGTYSTSPVLDQAYVQRKKTFTFAAQDLADAAANTAIYGPTTVLSESIASHAIWGSGSDRLKEVPMSLVCRAVRYQARKYGWPMVAWWSNDQTIFMAASTTPGTTSRMGYSAHARAGKVDMGGANYLNMSPGWLAGRGPIECESDSLGHVSFSTDSGGQLAQSGVLTIAGCLAHGASGERVGAPTILGKAYSSISSSGTVESPTVNRRRITCTVSGANLDVAYNSVTTSTARAAAVTQTIDLAATLPTGARLLGAEANVSAAVSGGGVATATLDVGWSGQQDAFLNAVDLLSATRQGESVSGNSTGYVGQLINGGTAIAPRLVIDSDVNISTWSAGTFTVDLFYWVMP